MLNRIMLIAGSVIIGITVSTLICVVMGIEELRHMVIPIYTALVAVSAWGATSPKQYTSDELYTDVCPLSCQYMGDHGCAIGQWSTTCPHREGGGVGINTLA